ncbi:MAG: hypothetical protein GY765_21790 [bacterium]|nr:hypothetical protein [bacterium]
MGIQLAAFIFKNGIAGPEAVIPNEKKHSSPHRTTAGKDIKNIPLEGNAAQTNGDVM